MSPLAFGRGVLRGFGAIEELVASPDGHLLAVGSGLGDEVSVWRLPEGDRPAQLVRRVAEPSNSLVFDPRGDTLWFGYARTHRWNYVDGVLEDVAVEHALGAPIALSPSGKHLFGARPPGDREELLLVDTADGALVWAVPTRGTLVTSACFSHDGERVLVGEHRGARVLDARDGSTLSRLTPPRSGRSVQVALARDGTLIVGAAGSNQLSIRDGGQPPERVVTLEFGLARFTLSADGRSLALVGTFGEVAVVDVPSGAVRAVALPRSASAGAAAAFAGRLLALANHHAVTLFDRETWTPLPDEPAHHDQVTGIVVSPDGRWVATAGGFDGTVRLWSTADGAHLCALPGHGNVILALDVSPDGAHVATGCADGCVRVFATEPDTHEPAIVVERAHDHHDVSAVVYLPRDGALVTLGANGTVTRRDASGRPMRTIVPVGPLRFTGTAPALAVSRDGQWLAASGSEGELALIDVETMAVAGLPSVRGRALAFAPHEPWLVVREEADTVLVRVPEGDVVRRLGDLRARDAAFDARGRLALALAGAPPLVLDLSREVDGIVPPGATAEATAVAFAPDGRLAIGFADGSGTLVDVPEVPLTPTEAAARDRARRLDAARALLAAVAAHRPAAGYRDALPAVSVEPGGLRVVLERGGARAEVSVQLPGRAGAVLGIVIRERGARAPEAAEVDGDGAAFAERIASWLHRRLGEPEEQDHRRTEPWLAALPGREHVRHAVVERTHDRLDVRFELTDLPTIEQLVAWLDASVQAR